jgi:glutamate racemase
MIGVFDSGHGGLTVLRALVDRFPGQNFTYLGDHANVPYGNRPAEDVLDLTTAAVDRLFHLGCRLVLLGCNTATAVAARHMQQVWLPESRWAGGGHNVLGIIAPTVEAATQTPWAVTTPQYPQKFNEDIIVVFGTARTIASGVYPEEIGKRCPRATVVQVTCAELAGAIEARARGEEINQLVATACAEATSGMSRPPDRAILGCTHFPLVVDAFRAALPPTTRLLSQPTTVADSLEDYLERKPQFRTSEPSDRRGTVRLLTSGDAAAVGALAHIFWPTAPEFEPLEPVRS